MSRGALEEKHLQLLLTPCRRILVRKRPNHLVTQSLILYVLSAGTYLVASPSIQQLRFKPKIAG
jgi:hypothetical protein